MYLKSIEVQGFKSFAQKICFEFHNGITGIVGPNGSGKSNVSDAVRWVLGEQSARQLRGGNMQDVIFAGTELRKPLSFASVAITLDNTDHQLPVEYEEVTVTRRLYRSGESEYLINGNTCRLRDINEMFYDTGIGKEGYSIIGQGQIDRILSGKAEERRELFDEAAGIVKFKRRKNAAVKKLEEEKQNLVRVTDILSELTRQVKPLEKQAEAARIYLARRQRQQLLDVQVFLEESAQSEILQKELEEKLALTGAELEESTRAYEQTRSEYDLLSGELDALEKKLEETRSSFRECTDGRQKLEGRYGILKEQIRTGNENKTQKAERLEAVKAETEKRREELLAITEGLRGLQAGHVRLEKEQAGMEAGLAQVREEIVSCEQAVRDGKNEIISLLDDRATTRGKVQRFDTLMEQMNIRKARLSQRMLQEKTRQEEQEKALQAALKKYDGVTALIASMNERMEQLQEEIHGLSEELKRQNEQMETGQAAFHRESSRLESLKNMAERYDGYGGSIRRVMEKKNEDPGLLGVVADLIHVEKKYETAIETALGGSIQNIVTDTEQTARRMIDYLKTNRFGRATFLPLDSLTWRGSFSPESALSEPGVIGTGDAVVEVEEHYRRLAGYLLGRVLIVDNIDHAIRIAGKYRHSLRIVTLEGESLSPGGSMTGGAFKNNSNLLGRRREIEELEASVNALGKDMQAVQEKINDNRSRRNILRDTLAELNEKIRSQYVEQNTAGLELKALKEQGEQIRSEFREIEKERLSIKEDTEKIREDHENVRRELEDSTRDEKELEEYIETRQKELEENREKEQSLSAALEKSRLALAETRQKESFSKENLDRIQSEMDELLAEKRETEQYLQQWDQEQNSRIGQMEQLSEEISGLAEQEKELKGREEELSGERDAKSTQQKALFDSRDVLSGRINLLDKECMRLRSQKEKQEENQEARINYIWEEYQLTPGHAREMKQDDLGPLRELKKEIQKIREEIRQLGPVNVNAIEEFRELSERHEFLSGQYDDIQKAQASLEEIIKDLEEGMRKQFAEKFRDIQQQYDRTFRELFGGGKGSLELEEGVDILEAGITVISQPPGKKLQNMMQLSGGEKALSAIALLFAIQNLKPSPFCLLDEIEAALDDSNVGRFAAYLKKLTEHTQFIVITHRRGTMNAADRLYGITMQEKGVSTLVSVDLVESQLTA